MSGGEVIDARGLLCPLPVLRLRKVLLALPEGTVVRMLATDRMAAVDVPHFCRQAGHAMMGMRDLDDGALEFTVRRGPSVPSAAGGLAPKDV
ncbi:MAG: sulfurtransferase TusA family protein [Paracoccus sp. (in: a-proteobacteria)]|uniref:sulfurtransferase TusA family protein n=1 Tax=Paracoccus sp. TaxID=267 RepID=UPI002E88C442|nr:sulfurtransferase TusA family protein [Pseudomonadota bacterium]